MMLRTFSISGRPGVAWLCILLLSISLWSEAQVSHAVTASGLVFSPKELVIDAGDTVVWTNTSGTHNVNGSKSVYPSNPESFGNDLGTQWIYSFVFNLPGVYDYRCDTHWTSGMTGTITVLSESTGFKQNRMDPYLSVYPNPASSTMYISAGQNIRTVSIYSISGTRILSFGDLNQLNHEISLEGMLAGVYLVEVDFENSSRQIVRLVKR
jgi:plastocyanin